MLFRSMPRWRRDQRELFYLSSDGTLTAVPIVNGPTLQFGAPMPLFQPHILGFGPGVRQQYDVTHDGQRFLINAPTEDQSAFGITVVLNWPALLKK